MSEKSLSIVLITSAIICGTCFLPSAPVPTVANRTQPAPLKAAVHTQAKDHADYIGNVALNKLDGAKIAEQAQKSLSAPTPAANDWVNRIAVVSK
jgi:hypothetical protein